MASYILIPDSVSQLISLTPRTITGITGILAMPFIHLSVPHLVGNIVPLVLMSTILGGVSNRPLTTMFSISVIGGSLLWLFGRSDTSHFGASVLLFGLASYLIVKGLKSRRMLDLAICAFVIVMYGITMIKGIIPNGHAVSWDGHLCGMLAGIYVAIVKFRYKKSKAKKS